MHIVRSMRYIKEFFRFLKHIKENKNLLKTLTLVDFKEQYLGSYFGIVWAFVRPLMFIGVMWFVFSYGFRARPIEDGTPFILWLLSGMIPWFFFSDALSKSTNAIISNKFLIKKVAFRVSILPLVKILSSLIIHLVFVAILFLMFILYGYKPSWYWLQIPYFIFSMIILLLGLGWLLSSIRVFVKDINEFIAVIIQFGFWLTPIFWSIKMIPQKYQYIIQLNPVYYIIEGFRDSLIYHIWIWEKVYLTLYFWVVALVFFIVGAIVFKRLRPHFGDVL